MSYSWEQYSEDLSKVHIGKNLPTALYLHDSLTDSLPNRLAVILNRVSHALKIESEWNLVKLYKKEFKVAYLNYPDFDNYAYPSLKQSITVDLKTLQIRKADYSNSYNAPILHRKELMVSEGYSKKKEFEEITEEGEKAQLYESTHRIGFENQWLHLIRTKGYDLDSAGRLVQYDGVDSYKEELIERQNTALNRDKLSTPMLCLAKHGYLDGQYTILDYGCGKGDDARELEAHELEVNSWDPNHHPEGELVESDIVNLGFVINVIEDKEERDDTIIKAFSYAKKMIVISAMIANDEFISRFKPYKDGVITKRKTFQKYYAQSELKEYVDSILGVDAIALAHGVFVVFKDETEAQDFLLERQYRKQVWEHLSYKSKPTISEEDKFLNLLVDHEELVQSFWEKCLNLGRKPHNNEVDNELTIKDVFGSTNKLFSYLMTIDDKQQFQLAEGKRKEDLIVFFALSHFEKRKYFKKFSDRLKYDVKYFFNNYRSVIDYSKDLLFTVGNPTIIEEYAVKAYQLDPIGEFVDGHSWILPRQYISLLAPELRIYVGCATQLYGDIEEFQLVKIHFTSGKVTLLRYDNWEKDEPLLLERVKIRMRDLDIDFFIYGDDYPVQPLINKEVFQYGN